MLSLYPMKFDARQTDHCASPVTCILAPLHILRREGRRARWVRFERSIE